MRLCCAGRARRFQNNEAFGHKTMRQVAGMFMEYEKVGFSLSCAAPRERKRKEIGKKVGGRKPHAELWPEVVAEARRLRTGNGKGGRLSYREISARLKDAGIQPSVSSSNDRGTAGAAAATAALPSACFLSRSLSSWTTLVRTPSTGRTTSSPSYPRFGGDFRGPLHLVHSPKISVGAFSIAGG